MEHSVYTQKLSLQDIQAYFMQQQTVERYSSLETGQQTAMDSVWLMELVAATAIRTAPHAVNVLDIGCGAGNYTLKLLEYSSGLSCTLLDVSLPMLERAWERVRQNTTGSVDLMHGDVRALELGYEKFDIVISGTALHHLRATEEWKRVFEKIFRSLKPDGAFWISDLVAHEHQMIHAIMWDRYAHYLDRQGGSAFREQVFRIIEKEDTPRSLEFQTNLLQEIGFTNVTILHKHACFAAFGGMKAAERQQVIRYNKEYNYEKHEF